MLHEPPPHAPQVAARHIARMSQADLRQAFTSVYGNDTHSNNNAWLRRKLLDAVGASRRLCNRANAKPRRRAAPSAKRDRPSPASTATLLLAPAPPAPAARPHEPRTLSATSGDGSSESSNSLSGPIGAEMRPASPAPGCAAPLPHPPPPPSVFMDGLLVNTHTFESVL